MALQLLHLKSVEPPPVSPESPGSRIGRWLLLIVLGLLALTPCAFGQYQQRELREAQTLLYLSFDHSTAPDFTTVSAHDADAEPAQQGSIVTAARGNGCAAGALHYRAAGLGAGQRGSIVCFARLPADAGPLLTLTSQPGGHPHGLLRVERSGAWLRVWWFDRQGQARGAELDAGLWDDGNWHHLALVWDSGRGQWRVDVDGVTQARGAGAPWTPGGWPLCLELTPAQGIDDLFVCGYELTPAQTAGLREGRLPTPGTLTGAERAPEGGIENDQAACARWYAGIDSAVGWPLERERCPLLAQALLQRSGLSGAWQRQLRNHAHTSSHQSPPAGTPTWAALALALRRQHARWGVSHVSPLLGDAAAVARLSELIRQPATIPWQQTARLHALDLATGCLHEAPRRLRQLAQPPRATELADVLERQAWRWWSNQVGLPRERQQQWQTWINTQPAFAARDPLGQTTALLLNPQPSANWWDTLAGTGGVDDWALRQQLQDGFRNPADMSWTPRTEWQWLACWWRTREPRVLERALHAVWDELQNGQAEVVGDSVSGRPGLPALPGGWLLSAAMLGGLAPSDDLPTVGQPAVTWPMLPEDVAPLVARQSAQSLHLLLHHLGSQQTTVTLRLWNLQSGDYELAVGPDRDGDELADEFTLLEARPNLTRGSELTLRLNPGATVVQLRQTAAQEVPRCDLALLEPTFRWRDDGHLLLRASAVNLGASAGQGRVRWRLDGQVLRERALPPLPAAAPGVLPSLELSYTQADLLGGQELTLELVSATPAESSSANNAVTWRLPELLRQKP